VVASSHPIEGAAVLVIGGSSGIGLASARLARARGARVWIAARDAARLERARRELGADVRASAVDAASEISVASLFEAVGSLDHVLCTAGAVVAAPRLAGDLGQLRAQADLRLAAALHVVRSAAPRLSAGGSITFLSGTASQRPHPGGALDSAACAAVEGLTRALAVELAPLRVNALCPGPIDTPLLARALGPAREAYLAQVAAQLPARRIGAPDDVAEAALFLMSCGFVTGVVLPVDGGLRLI
jgi:NAD(P)-dependent dehydrogenase (short-subunit alcohol dehydrogenase family)